MARIFLTVNWKCNIISMPVYWSIGWLVCQNFLIGWIGTFPSSYRSTCFLYKFQWFHFTHVCNSNLKGRVCLQSICNIDSKKRFFLFFFRALLSGFRFRSDIDRSRIQPLRTNRIRIQTLRTNRIRIWIQTPLSWKLSIYFMMSFIKKLLPFSFFDGP